MARSLRQSSGRAGDCRADNTTEFDTTIEYVEDRFGTDEEYWSVMTGGSHVDQYIEPTNASYVAFSIEELLTVSTEDTAVEGNG